MRRARSLQQRMQLQQRPQDSEAVRQHPEQQQEEEQQLQEQPSEKALTLQILLTNRQGDQSAASQDQQALPLSPCFVKPLPPKTISDPASSTGAPSGSPSEDSRTEGPCTRVGKPLSDAGSLPAVCVDTWEQSPLEDLAPPPPPEEVEFSAQWTKTSPVPIPAQALPPLRPYSRTPSPIGTNDGCRQIMEKEPCYVRQGQTTPPLSSSTSRVAPPPPTRNWSCLHLDPPDDVVDSSDPPTYATADSPSSAPPPPVNQPDQAPSAPPAQSHRALLPVERWAENVNRYFSFKNAAGEGEGGGGGGEEAASPCEELSELDSLYQASLLAPSMHRGSRGVSPQPTGNKPGVRRMVSGSGRSKTPTAEIERYAYRTPVTPLHKTASGEDESYSADNLRRIARSLSGTVIGSRPQNIGASRSCDPSVSRPPPSPADLHSSSSSSSFLLRRPSTSSLHLPSSSFTDPSFHHLQPRHHGPSAPAPPPQHPPSQTSRPHSSGPSTRGRTGVAPSVQQQFLVVSDRHQALSGQSLHSIAMSYGTLPRAPRRAPPPFSSLPRSGDCSTAPPPAQQSLYATLSHPRRSANTGTNGHYRQPSLPSKVNGSAHYPPHHNPPHHNPPHHLRVPGEAPSQPLRLDVPPETDWRREADYRTVQPSSSWDLLAARHHHHHHHHPPIQRTQSHHAPPHRPRRDPLLCSLCQQLPAEPPRPYCASCGAYVARFRPAS
nr:PREDICTED: pollen-specific leucine-rich repeat extensin-like protein 2 [Paralichthys olivaceus]